MKNIMLHKLTGITSVHETMKTILRYTICEKSPEHWSPLSLRYASSRYIYVGDTYTITTRLQLVRLGLSFPRDII